jgi:hypothetical protein
MATAKSSSDIYWMERVRFVLDDAPGKHHTIYDLRDVRQLPVSALKSDATIVGWQLPRGRFCVAVQSHAEARLSWLEAEKIATAFLIDRGHFDADAPSPTYVCERAATDPEAPIVAPGMPVPPNEGDDDGWQWWGYEVRPPVAGRATYYEPTTRIAVAADRARPLTLVSKMFALVYIVMIGGTALAAIVLVTRDHL